MKIIADFSMKTIKEGHKMSSFNYEKRTISNLEYTIHQSYHS
jgi:hypothetical protein